MSEELTLEQLKALVSNTKKYNALLDVVNKMHQILSKKSIAKKISKKDKEELLETYTNYLSIE